MQADIGAGARRTAWLAAVGAIALVAAALVALFWQGLDAMVAVWRDSATFNHCFLIVPIVLWLVAEQRQALARLVPTPWLGALLALVPVSLLWLVGSLATVLEVQEFAVVAMLQIAVVAILGSAVTRILWFPIAYLLFLVPTGEWAVPLLQKITAALAVFGLDAVGVPVYSDGLLIEIPGGKFFVAEACAGMRFLIATVAFGCLFCWLNLRTPRRIAGFLLATLLVPILANSVRAFGIVLIGYLYGVDSAVVTDHVIYGWGFFALITLLLTLIGLRFREPAGASPVPLDSGGRPLVWTMAAAAGAILLAAVGPALAAFATTRVDTAIPAALHLGDPMLPWTTRPPTRWNAEWQAADATLVKAFAADGSPVELRIVFVTRQRKGAEALGFASQLTSATDATALSQQRGPIGRDGNAFEAVVSRISGNDGVRLVWHWYWVDGAFTASPAAAKLHQVIANLAGHPAAALIVLATADDPRASARMSDLLAHLPPLTDVLTGAGR